MHDIQIGGHLIGDAHRPFVIAEMSGNHNQSIERAKEIIDAAAESGAHAIKFQTYTPDTLTINVKKGLFYISDEKSLWFGQTLYDLYKVAYTPWEWHKELFEHARSRGIIPFSSPFDETSVDFLESLDVPCYKIASFENNHLPLLRKVAQTGKPVIVSTGLSTVAGIYETVNTLREAGCKDLILLKCTSSYPATPENTHLLTIPHMRDLFRCHVGLSDHTMGIGVPLAAVALGARVIEKHFTLRRADGGVDSTFSLEPDELKALVVESERGFQGLGRVSYDILEAERNSLRFKRSVYITEDVKKGEVFTEKNVRIIRPGDGLHPRYLPDILGRRASGDIEKGTPASWNLIN
ncbi:MAG TPA: pseudaminic acid synthase [Flavisolibacter sp.]|nr:pseudaminic acid synthase [Flavisolibacter sp.]